MTSTMSRERDAGSRCFRFNTAVVCRVASSFGDRSSFDDSGAPDAAADAGKRPHVAECRQVYCTQGDVTSRSLWPRYDRRFVGIMGLLQLRYEHDSSTIRLRFERDTTSYEELCAFEQ